MRPATCPANPAGFPRQLLPALLYLLHPCSRALLVSIGLARRGLLRASLPSALRVMLHVIKIAPGNFVLPLWLVRASMREPFGLVLNRLRCSAAPNGIKGTPLPVLVKTVL